MGGRTYCTLFDRNYAARAVALHESLTRHEGTFTLWAFCMDDDALRLMQALALPNVHLVPLADLEAWDPRLATARGNRSRLEYYFTCAPAVTLHTLERSRAPLVAYLDADLFLYASLDPLFAEMGDAATLIVPHRFARNLAHMRKYGEYNVGLVAFRNDPDGSACLRWWHESCLAWCHDRLEDGKYGDQKYLEQFPKRHHRVHVLGHKGGGVGPWNLRTHEVVETQQGPRVGGPEGDALVFAHLQGLKPDPAQRGRYRLGASAYRVRLTADERRLLYAPYVQAVARAERQVAAAAAHLPPPQPLPRAWSASASPGLVARAKQALLPRLDRLRARLLGDYMATEAA